MARGNDFFRVRLPWPDWSISPNSRAHYQHKAAIVKQHRHIARLVSLDALGFGNWIDADRVYAVWLFHDPDKRRRDTGNIRATMKAYQDGVFDALRVDDYAVKDEFLHRASEIIPGGGVELRLYEDHQAWLDDVIVLSNVSITANHIDSCDKISINQSTKKE